MFEIYCLNANGISIFPKGENIGRYFHSSSKSSLMITKNLLTIFDKLISFSECPENLKSKILEYYPELGEENDEFVGYTVS